MRSPGNFLKIAALWAVVALAHGQATDPAATSTTATSSAAMASPAPLQLPPERRWRLGAAFGYGERTNPLIQSDDIPVIVDLDIAWFGKRWFFDNGDVGFTLFDRRAVDHQPGGARQQRSRVLRQDQHRYVNFAYAGRAASSSSLDPDTGALHRRSRSKSKPPIATTPSSSASRSLIDGDWGAATLRAFHDVSGTHGGYELSAYYSRRWIAGRFSLSPIGGRLLQERRAQRLLLGRARGRSQRSRCPNITRAAGSASKLACSLTTTSPQSAPRAVGQLRTAGGRRRREPARRGRLRVRPISPGSPGRSDRCQDSRRWLARVLPRGLPSGGRCRRAGGAAHREAPAVRPRPRRHASAR